MSKIAPAGVSTFLASLPGRTSPAWRSDLVSVTLLDGTILRWTTADLNLVVGGNTYLAKSSTPFLSRGNRRETSQLQVDGISVNLAGAALLSGQTVCRRANDGYFDDARVQIDHLVGNDPAHAISLGPIMAWWEGKVAGVDPAPDVVRLGLASDLEQLGVAQLPQFRFGPACLHAVYDLNCTLNKATFTLTGTASGVPTTTTVPTASAALTAKAAGYFNLGVLVFTSGALTGVRRAVKSWTSNTFTLYLPLPSAPAAGDAISVYPGCARTKLDCGPTGSGGKFNNLVNFRGFVHVPISEGAR
jgi:uncharacterized phage protein (TIGR02218 family)